MSELIPTVHEIQSEADFNGFIEGKEKYLLTAKKNEMLLWTNL
jgi:hypothetical protein